MRNKLIIGELAKLTDTSAFNIRYYEKEGLIQPSEIDENGYRLYDYEETYKLGLIRIFRDVDIPIAEIKELLADFTQEKYNDALALSQKKITEQIKRLTNLKSEIKARRSKLDYVKDIDKQFTIKHFKEQKFYHVVDMDYTEEIEIKTIYDTYSRLKLNLNDIYKLDDFYLLKEDYMIHGVVTNDKYDIDYTLMPEGDYLCYEYITQDGDNTEERYQELTTYIYENDLIYEGELFFRVDPELYRLNDVNYYCELLIKVGKKT